MEFFCFVMAFAAFTGGLALFLERRLTWNGRPFHAREVGFVFAYAGLLGILVQSFLGRLVRRFGEPWLVAAGFASMAVGYGLLAGRARAAAPPRRRRLQLVRHRRAPAVAHQPGDPGGGQERAGRGAGPQHLAPVGGQIIGPAVAGLLIDHGLLGVWALFCAGCALVGLVVQRSAAAPGREMAVP